MQNKLSREGSGCLFGIEDPNIRIFKKTSVQFEETKCDLYNQFYDLEKLRDLADFNSDTNKLNSVHLGEYATRRNLIQ